MPNARLGAELMHGHHMQDGCKTRVRPLTAPGYGL